MRHTVTRVLCLVLLVAGLGGNLLAQSLPTAQPSLLQIVQEDIKVGHSADHVKTEAGWPAAYEKARYPYYYLALATLTGTSQVWFIQPFDSHQAMADALKRSEEPVLEAELGGLSRADATHLSGQRTINAAARKDLSHGAFPDSSKQRFYEITVLRVRPGHEEQFATAAKAYGAATGRGAPGMSFRVYEVTAGMPSPTYLVITSVVSYADFDKAQADGEALIKAATADERAALQKFDTEALLSAETHQFSLDPRMSYVPKEVRAQDTAFWMPKKPVTAGTDQKKKAQP